ncbi:hypothetical protein [Nonomuraea sp. 10N515B]
MTRLPSTTASAPLVNRATRARLARLAGTDGTYALIHQPLIT